MDLANGSKPSGERSFDTLAPVDLWPRL